MICAIANYGYDWVLKPKNGKLPPGKRDHIVSVQDAWLAARDSDEDINFDDDAMNPHFSYLDENNLRRDVWFVDGVTALNQMRAAQNMGIQTFALWRLGVKTDRYGGSGMCPEMRGRPTNCATCPRGPTSIWKGKAKSSELRTNRRTAFAT